MYGWWVLLQSWGTMRLSDRRGLSLADISFTDGNLTGLLRRTKTTGTGQNVTTKPVRVDAESYISSALWLSVGRQILTNMAPIQRDHLLPAPASAYDCCLRSEPRYALGFAMQSRLLASLIDCKGDKVLTAETAGFWTPHSGRSFLPSCTAALGFPKEEHPRAATHSQERQNFVSLQCRRLCPRRLRGPEGDILLAGNHDPAG